MWTHWMMTALFVWAGLDSINDIGKPRKPQTNTGAVCAVIAAGLMVWALWTH